MGAMASQITGVTIVYSTVNLGADQRKYQGYASLAFAGNSLVNDEFPAQKPETRTMFPFDAFPLSTMKLWFICVINLPGFMQK